jgi:Cation transporter/ATPase, N-terminus
MALTRSPGDVPVDTGHHGLAPHEVVLLLETDPKRGLAEPEAAQRLERLGPNVLPAAVGGAGRGQQPAARGPDVDIPADQARVG